jgi:hypothetical protein
MDTIADLEDSLTHQKMANVVIKDHPFFTYDNVEAALNTQANKYDHDNNAAACKFLIASLDDDLADKLEEH